MKRLLNSKLKHDFELANCRKSKNREVVFVFPAKRTEPIKNTHEIRLHYYLERLQRSDRNDKSKKESILLNQLKYYTAKKCSAHGFWFSFWRTKGALASTLFWR